jgi:hypothetical protein
VRDPLGAGRRSVRRRLALLLPAALLGVGVLAGCSTPSTGQADAAATSQAPASDAPATTAAPTSSASTPAAGPLTCADLVPKQQIIAALAGGRSERDWVVLPTSTAAGTITTELAVRGAGGLSCSWSAGPPQSETTPAVLTVAVLPGAAADWSAMLYGDGPTPLRRTFAGVSAAAACGDPGCGASAPVGSSWVRVDLATGSRESGGSVFAQESDDEVLAGMRPAVETVFRAVQHASAAQLRFPNHLTGDATPADCRTFLTKADIDGALRVHPTTVDTDRQPTGASDSISGDAQHRLGESVCTIMGHATSNDFEAASITVAPGQSWAVDELTSVPAARGAFHVTRVAGQVSGEHAVTDCTATRTTCTVVFSLGSTAIQVEDTDRAVEVAAAIVAGAR